MSTRLELLRAALPASDDLLRHAVEPQKLLDGDQVQELLRRRRVFPRRDREVQPLEREPVGLRVERVPRVIGHLDV